MDSIEIDLSSLKDVAAIDAKHAALVNEAVQKSSEFVRDSWVNAVSGQKFPNLPQAINDQDYANSIKIHRTGPLSAVVYTDYAGAESYKAGRASYDLKPALLSGPHSKTSKKGTRYNTVPFRFKTGTTKSTSNTPTALPSDVYRAALQGQKITPLSPMAYYGWRTKLMGTPTMDQAYTWSSGLYQGIKKVPIGKGKNAYMTFRGVSSKSNPLSWIVPGKPPMDIKKAVETEITPLLPQIAAGILARLRN